MDRLKKQKLPRSVVRTLIHLGKMKIKRKPRHSTKHKSPKHGPLIRRIILSSAQFLASPSVSSLQELNATNINRIVVNVGGTKYEIAKINLEKYPDTLLGSERKKYFYDEERMEYFFDRDPVIFKNIAEFYRVGFFHVSSPTTVCMEAILDELAFFGIPQHQVSDCCCEHIILGDEEQEKKKRQIEAIESKQAKEYSLWTAREKLWEFLTNTKSSKTSAAFGYLFGAVVALNISTIVAETVPTKSGDKLGDAYHNEFFGIDSFCVGIFTFEFVARLYSSPNRLEFAREMSNVIDLLGIIPYYIAVVERAVQSNNPILDFFVTVFRMFRVFRITKLARHSERFQNLLLSIRSAATELGGILFSFLALMVTFSSIMYYFERKEDKTEFISIPAAFWYTLVTMTTLGYGDIFPTTVNGKLLGAVCALMGVLLLALPVPIIERKLNEFGKKSKPRTVNTTAKLTASLPSLAAHNVCKNQRGGQRRKGKCVHMDSQTTSMIVEVSNSSTASSESDASFHSSLGSFLEPRNTHNEPLTEVAGFSDVNGNRRTYGADVIRTDHKSWHGNGDEPTGVGQGIFTESPPSSKYFAVFQQFSASSDDDALEDRSPSDSFVDDDENKEMIPMKKLRRQWSFDEGEFFPVIVTPRNCVSVADLA